ncbi:pilin [Ectopseudomonas chengduensis]|nr:pilin [Pseudomonas chengduensis]WKC39727.1 pilin [Pseudomonas chengduensis]
MDAKSKGFTLIEVMMVVAVIGVLAVIAVPMYQGYVISSQVKRAHAELANYKGAFEVALGRGQTTISNSDLGYVRSSLVLDSDIATVQAGGAGSLQVTMGDGAHPAVQGVLLAFYRDVSGTWRCDVDPAAASAWSSAYMPQGCE